MQDEKNRLGAIEEWARRILIELEWLKKENKPKVLVAEDGPDMRKARLVKALRRSKYPVRDKAWYEFCNTCKSVLSYPGRDTAGPIVPWLCLQIHMGKVNEGMIDTLLEMVIE